MKILITGGAGFIGFNCALMLKEKGYEDIHIFDNFEKGRRPELEKFTTIHRGDLSKVEDLERCLKTEAFDGILHFGGQTAVTLSVKNPRRDFETNALGTFNLLELVRKICPETKIIYSSSNKVYGTLKNQKISEANTRYKLTESPNGIKSCEPLDFHSPYGCSKGAADQYAIDYSRIFGLKTFVLRQSCVYGSHQSGTEDQGWIAWFIQSFLNKSPLTIYGNGKQVRDILHVTDLVDLCETILKSDALAGAYNVGGGVENSISLLEMLDFLRQNIYEKEVIFLEERPGDQRVFYSDNTKLKEDFNWEPKMQKHQGLKQTIDFLSNTAQ